MLWFSKHGKKIRYISLNWFQPKRLLLYASYENVKAQSGQFHVAKECKDGKSTTTQRHGHKLYEIETCLKRDTGRWSTRNHRNGESPGGLICKGRLEEVWREGDATSSKTSRSTGADSVQRRGWNPMGPTLNWWPTRALFFTFLLTHVPWWLWQLQITASSQADMQGSSGLSSAEPWASCQESRFRMDPHVARRVPSLCGGVCAPLLCVLSHSSKMKPLCQHQLLCMQVSSKPLSQPPLASRRWVPQMWSCLSFRPQQKSDMTIFIAVAILGAGWRFSPLVAEHCPFIFHHALQVCKAKTSDTNRFYQEES